MKTERISCIYTITNLVNGKMYVGYSSNFKMREYQHKSDFLLSKIKNPYLQKSVNKHGIENFKIEILEECEERFLTALEHYWATILNTHNDKYGYNSKPTHPDNKSGVNTKRLHKKAVCQYNLKGEKINTFSSAKQAGETTKSCNSHISECCKLKRTVEKGSLWRYEKDNIEKIDVNFGIRASITDKDVIDILELIRNRVSHKEIAKIYNKDKTWVSWRIKQYKLKYELI